MAVFDRLEGTKPSSSRYFLHFQNNQNTDSSLYISILFYRFWHSLAMVPPVKQECNSKDIDRYINHLVQC